MFYEIFINNFWTQSNLKSIEEENFFLFNLNNETVRISQENIRVINPPSKTSFSSLSENQSVEYEYLKGNWIPAKITNRNGRFYALSIEVNGVNFTVLAREGQIRHCEHFSLHKFYDNLVIELPKSIDRWEDTNYFNEIMHQIIEQLSKKVYFCFFSKDGHKYLRFFGEKETLKSAKILTDISINNELKLLKLEEEKYNQRTNLRHSESLPILTKKILIDKSLTSLLIGARGKNVMNIKGKYNVDIKIENGDENDIVLIKGDNQSKIEQCAREVELVYKKFNLKHGNDYQLRGHNDSFLNSLIYKHYLYNLYIEKEWVDNKLTSVLTVIGTEDTIKSLLNDIRGYIIIN